MPTYRGLIIGGVLAVTGLAIALSFWPPAGPVPVAIVIHAVKHASLIRTDWSPRVPAYSVRAKPAFLFEPATPESGRCDPFAGGHLELAWSDETRDETQEGIASSTLSLSDEAVRSVPGGFLLRLTSAQLAPGTPEARAALDRPGHWRVHFRWFCRGGRSPRLQTMDLAVYLPRDKTDFWRRHLGGIHEQPEPARISAYGQALGLTEDPIMRAWILEALFQAQKAVGEFHDAASTAERWAVEAARGGLLSDVARAWIGAYEVARDTGRMADAEAYLDRSEALIAEIGDLRRSSDLWTSRCLLSERRGELLEALEACDHAGELTQQVGRFRRGEALQLLELALLQQLGHYRLVNETLEETVLTRELRDIVEMGTVGWLLLRGVEAGVPLGRDQDLALEKAATLFRRALKLAQENGNLIEALRQQFLLANVAITQGHLEEAKSLLQQVADRHRETPEALTLFMPWARGRLAILEGALPEAMAQFEILAAQAEEAGDRLFRGRAAFGAGEVYRLRGALKEALEAYDEALASLSAAADDTSVIHQRAVATSQASWEARAIQVRLESGLIWEALAVAEAGPWRRRAAIAPPRAEAVPADSSQQKRREVLSRQEQALEAELKRIRLRAAAGASPTGSSDHRAELKEQLEGLWAERRALDQAHAVGPPPPLIQAEILERIPPGTSLLRYAVLPDEIITWRIDARGVEALRQPIPRWRLEEWVLEFSKSCARGAPDPVVGQRLAALLLDPWLEPVQEALVIIGDGVIRNLPWAALPVSDGFLVQQAVLSFFPSLYPESDPGWQAGEGILVVADPSRDLKGAMIEARLLKDRFPQAMLLQRGDATRKAVVGAMGQVAQLHYGGHAVTEPRNPYLSYLRLAEDEPLRLRDVLEHRLHARLVFLNACGAGQVALDGGGAVGLADGFLAAGARTVIASRWDVPDAMGYQVSDAFYAHLVESEPTDEARALAMTQRDLIKTDENTAESTAWSAYYVLTSIDRWSVD